MMSTAFERVYETAEEHGVSLRIGAYVMGIRKVAEALRIRGIYA